MPRYPNYKKKKNVKSKGKGRNYKVVFYKNKSKESMIYDPRSGGVPFPSKYFTKFTGTLTGRLAAATLTDKQLPIKMNSIITPFDQCTDPAFTFPSINPLVYVLAGTSNLLNVNMYNYFRVLGCRIDIDIQPDDISDVMMCTVTPTNSDLFPTNVREATEQKFTMIGTFGNGREPVITTMSGRILNKARSMKHYMTTAKFLGVPKKAIDYDLSGVYTGSYASDPAGLHYWNVWIGPLDGVATSSPVAFRITVTYYTEVYGFIHPSF